LVTNMSKIEIGPRVTPYPMPVTIVGTRFDDRVNFMTVAWINRINNDPPIWAAGINKRHYTIEGLKQAKTFSINFPSSEMITKTDYCGLGSGKKIDKTKVFEVFYGKLGNAPMIKDAPLAIECEVYDVIELPTNNLVLGKVIAAYTEAKYLTDEKLDLKKMNPVVLTMPDNRYWTVGEYLAKAWDEGKKMM
jgi:flavin reductase (DIM6/NTAB) family NADH-FMN oxidoreductase RutF